MGTFCAASESAPYPRRFLDTYGRTKAESERRVRAASGSMATAILRFSAMYGEGDPYKVPSMIDEARAGRLLFRIGDGRAHMQPLYVGNAAAATLLALDRLLSADEDTKGKTFFIADHPAGNFFDWMAPIMAGLGYPLPTRRLPGWIARVWWERGPSGSPDAPAAVRPSRAPRCERSVKPSPSTIARRGKSSGTSRPTRTVKPSPKPSPGSMTGCRPETTPIDQRLAPFSVSALPRQLVRRRLVERRTHAGPPCPSRPSGGSWWRSGPRTARSRCSMLTARTSGPISGTVARW